MLNRKCFISTINVSTGIRVSELCSIKDKDIDLEERTLKIFGKGSKERMLSIESDEVIKTQKI